MSEQMDSKYWIGFEIAAQNAIKRAKKERLEMREEFMRWADRIEEALKDGTFFEKANLYERFHHVVTVLVREGYGKRVDKLMAALKEAVWG